ncbi:MAG: DUF2634 domain-containing protein [Lachnospiraceae bacterium]|nr:DUF2634 domain-containing protein [Lachnospiraceae bacterium]
MTPQTLLKENVEITNYPSKTYKLNDKTKTIVGIIDGVEAVKQAVFCYLNIERFQWIIYSWNIGIETKHLYGEPVDWVCSEIERVVQEALSIDDRIEEVDNFDFNIDKRKILVSFTVKTIYGEFDYNMEVDL